MTGTNTDTTDTDRTRPVIGLTGLARSGKDTAADRLTQRWGFTRFALGDEVRTAALAVDPLIPDPRGNPWYARTLGLARPAVRLSSLVAELGWDKTKALAEGRRTLQHVGSDAGWMIHGEDLWTRRTRAQIDEIHPHSPVVVTDIRMPHEADWIRSMGGIVVRIVRPSQQSLQGALGTHISETGGLAIDKELVNDRSIEHLHAAVDELYDALYPDASR